MRLIYKLRSEQLDLVDSAELHQALASSHNYTIQAELISQLARPRVPELSACNSIDPIEALKTYLDNREDLQEIAASMLEAAQKLLTDDEEDLLASVAVEVSNNSENPGENQLRVLG